MRKVRLDGLLLLVIGCNSAPQAASPAALATALPQVSAIATANKSVDSMGKGREVRQGDNASLINTPFQCVPLVATRPVETVKGWTALARGTASVFSALSVSATDTNTVWAVGSEGSVVYTIDHGSTFVTCMIGAGEALIAVWAVSRDDVWIVGSDHVFRVENRANLTTIALQSHPGTSAGALFGRSSKDLWIANGSLLHTVDRGATWASVDACGDGLNTESTEVAGSTTDLWTTCNFAAAGSRDLGATWNRGWSSQEQEQLHVSVSNEDVWIVGQDSHKMARSIDNGATWSNELLPISALSKVWNIWSAGRGWAWVHSSAGVWARRGKRSWIRELPPDLVHAIGGTSERDVWAVGANGLILHRN